MVLKKGELIARMEPVEQRPIVVNSVGITPCSAAEDKETLWKMVSEVGGHISSTEKEQLFSVLSAYGDVFLLA